ncbi:hypothetical protein AB1N83_005372 [Pleurotus pulmonarius]
MDRVDESKSLVAGLDPSTSSHEPSVVEHLPIELIRLIIDSIDDQDDKDEKRDSDADECASECSEEDYSTNSPFIRGIRTEGKYHPSRSLLICSLVCRAWNEISRVRIFHKLTVAYWNINARLHFLHFTAPHLASYVVEFHLMWVGDGREPAEWVPVCLGSLKNLSIVHILERPSSAIHRPPSLAPVCRSLLAAPLLQELLLAGLVFRRGSVDLIDFLSIPSATLEKLTLLSILSPEEERTTAERTVVRMDRLRTIRFLETTHDVLRQHHIECPHLRSVFVQLRSDKPWLPPPWIPHGLSEIIIRLPTDRPVPEFGNYIRPSDMTIDVFEDYSYSRSLDWVQCCINHLPFPEQLIRLTINITVDLRYAPVTYSPDPVDYQKLCDALQILYKHGSLQYVNLGLTIGGNGRAEDAFIQANEVQKLKETFAALFDASVLAAKLVFIRLRGFRESVLFTTTLY